MNAFEKFTTLQESVSVLLEEAKACDNLEEAKDLIEKASDLQEKAVDIIEKADDNCKDGECDKKEDKKVDEEAIQETIAKLLNAAVLTEDVDQASAYIQKAEELQKAIDDIPEEKETEDDEYDPEVNGADSDNSDPDMEDIKDLVDGDQEAIKILTDDSDSITIDA